MQASPQHLSTSQAAERLSLSREHVRRLIQRGELRATETVNGFTIHVEEVERFAAMQQAQRDKRAFRSALDDFASKVRRVEGADVLRDAVATLRDLTEPAFLSRSPAEITTPMKWMNEQITANAAFAVLQEPMKVLVEHWTRTMNDSLTNVIRDNGISKVVDQTLLDATARLAQPDVTEALTTHVNEETARGFIGPVSREARLEEKVDELSRKVEQLTEIVTHRRADPVALPTWQEWAKSDRPEDVLAKLDAVREEVTGGKQMPENSTNIIRESREARGQGG